MPPFNNVATSLGPRRGTGEIAPFPLLRYFTLASFIAIVILTIPFGIFHRQVVVTELLKHGEMHNVAIARAFSNSLWPQFASFVNSVSGLSGDAIRSRPETARIHQAVLVLMQGLSVLKVKIYSLDGLTVFSTEARQIGEDQSGNPGFLGARSGKTVSLLTRRGEFYSFEGVVQNRDVLTTYFPIRSGNPAKPLDGIVEVYRDVTPLVREVNLAQAREWVAVISPLVVLYISLFFIVRHADKVIKRQDAERSHREGLLRLQHERLSVLNDVNAAITSTLEIQEVLKRLLEEIERHLPFAGSAVRLLDPKTVRLDHGIVRNLDENELRAARRKAGTGVTGFSDIVLRNKSPLVIKNMRTDSSVPAMTEFLVKHGFVSYLGLPLMARGEILGVLSLLTREEHEFSDAELLYLSTLAGQAAIAVYNAGLFERIKKQAAELKKANEMQADFAAMIAHDFRAPLVNVIGAAGMVEDGLMGPVNDEQKQWLSKVGNESRRLVDFLNDFLDLSKLEAGRIGITKTSTDLNAFIKDSVENVAALARNKDLSIRVRIEGMPGSVMMDSGRMGEVLNNLLSNAIKFTGKGGVIEVGAGLETGLKAPGATVKIWVRDTGIGIPPEEIGDLFQKYRQTGSGKGSKEKGTGLGLVICKMIAEAHGGEIQVESEVAKGSTFTVRLPVEDSFS